MSTLEELKSMITSNEEHTGFMENQEDSSNKTVEYDDTDVNSNSSNSNATKEEPEEVKTRFASEEVAEFNTFKERFPDKTIDDYKRLKTPTADISEEELLRQYYTEKVGMGEKEIAYALKERELNRQDSYDDFDDFSLDEDERLKREALREKDLRLAREWREQYVSEQLSPAKKESDTPTYDSVEDYQKAMAEQAELARGNYLKSVYGVLSGITEIELEANGEKTFYIPDEEFKKEMKATSENIGSLYEKFLNQDGTFKDPKGFITEVALWANPITREKMVSHRIEQAILRDRAAQSRVRRNVGLDNVGNVSTTIRGEAEAVRDYFDNKNRGSW